MKINKIKINEIFKIVLKNLLKTYEKMYNFAKIPITHPATVSSHYDKTILISEIPL